MLRAMLVLSVSALALVIGVWLVPRTRPPWGTGDAVLWKSWVVVRWLVLGGAIGVITGFATAVVALVT
jgi:hypothetical protein